MLTLFYDMYGSKLYNYNMLNEAQGNFTFTCYLYVGPHTSHLIRLQKVTFMVDSPGKVLT